MPSPNDGLSTKLPEYRSGHSLLACGLPSVEGFSGITLIRRLHIGSQSTFLHPSWFGINLVTKCHYLIYVTPGNISFRRK